MKEQKNAKCWQGCGTSRTLSTARAQFDTITLENYLTVSAKTGVMHTL